LFAHGLVSSDRPIWHYQTVATAVYCLPSTCTSWRFR